MPFDIYTWLKDNPPPPSAPSPPAQVPAAPARERRREKEGRAGAGNGHASTRNNGNAVQYTESEQYQNFIIACARAYISKKGPAVAGENGHRHTFSVACSLIIGFDLNPETALGLMLEWNRECQPPWLQEDIQQKLDDAIIRRNGDPKRGALIPEFKKKACNFTDDQPKETPSLPQIVITPKEGTVIRESIAAIINAPDDFQIYQRGGMLVDVITRNHFNRRKGNLILSESPYISPIKAAKLRGILTDLADYGKWRRNDDGEWEFKPCSPPDWLATAVLANNVWEGIPYINSISECPILRPDGSIIDEHGYDEETGIFYIPNGTFLPVPAKVSEDDARASLNNLQDIIDEFPFKSRLHKCAWLAALLTPFIKFAINAPCPLFLIDANSAGTGKSRLCDIISIISSGRTMPRTVFPDSDEEMRKRITSLLLSGERTVLIDNIPQNTSFGSASIDAVLTSQNWSDRILGKSEMAASLRNDTIWFATGNNVALTGDIHRRIIPCTLETDVENPYEREFKYQDILDHVKRNRTSLVRDCLTILRGFVQAGMPAGLPHPMGSFEEWSRYVRSCVYWITGEDCVEAQREMREMDRQTNIRSSIIHGLATIPGIFDQDGLTASKIIEIVKSNQMTEHHETLKQCFNDFFGKDPSQNMYPSSREFGFKLKSLKNCVSGKYRLVGIPDPTGILHWRIDDMENPEHYAKPKLQSELEYDDD